MPTKSLSKLIAQPAKRTLTVALGFLLMGSAVCSSAVAQAWPTKPVKVVVNFPPGGAADQIARAIGIPLAEALGQPVVVENRGGANGNLGGDMVAKSAADGYTLLMSSGGMVSVNPHIYARMSFDPAKDLVPVASAARVLVYLVAKPNFPADNIQGFLKYVKENPGKLSYGSAGNGSSPHLAGEMMKSQAGLFAVHVPYRARCFGRSTRFLLRSRYWIGPSTCWQAQVVSCWKPQAFTSVSQCTHA